MARRAPQARRRRNGGSRPSTRTRARTLRRDLCAIGSEPARLHWPPLVPPPGLASGRRQLRLCSPCLAPPLQSATATRNPTPRRPTRRPPAPASPPPAKRPHVAGRTCRNLWALMSLPVQACQRQAAPMLEQGDRKCQSVTRQSDRFKLGRPGHVGLSGPAPLHLRSSSVLAVCGRLGCRVISVTTLQKGSFIHETSRHWLLALQGGQI